MVNGNSESGAIASNRTTVATVLLVILAVGVATTVILLTTPYGLSLRDDSYSYVAGAVSLARGTGFGRLTGDGSVNLITNFPPLYSLVLAASIKIGVDVYLFARVFSSALFGLTALAAALGVHRATSSVGFAALAAGVVIGSDTLIEQYVWLQSEPLFLCLTLVGLVSIGSYISNPSRRGSLVLATSAIALAAYTRFAGVGLILAGSLAILVLDRRPIAVRIRQAGLLMVVGVTPIIAFAVRNLGLKGSAANRPAPFWHPPVANAWHDALLLSLKWLIPDRIAALLTSSALVSLVTFVALALVSTWLGVRLTGKARTSSPPDPLLNHLTVQALFCLTYLITIVMTVLFFDRLTPLDERILAPVHLSILIILALGAAYLSRDSTLRRRWSIGLLVTAFAAFHILRSALVVESLALDGRGYASQRWRTSPTLAYARSLPAVPIFTNNLPAMYFVAGRTAYAIPTPTNLSSLEANASYARELSAMRKLLREGDGYLVYVGYPPTDPQGVAELEALTSGLVPVHVFSEGTIYQAQGD
jgi:hypothetical protein